MVCNDARARHVVEACRRIAAHVPEDIAIVSVDDDTLICESMSPPLTSVDLGGYAAGYAAARVLDRLMSGRNVQRHWIVVEPKGLVCRQSSDVFAVHDAEVQAALRFIHEHACDSICIHDVSQAVSISQTTLQRRFRSFLGRSVHDEIDRVRIERACCLVTRTDLPLTKISLQLGFKQVGYLTKVFRRHLGRTPSEYRQERLAQNTKSSDGSENRCRFGRGGSGM